MSLTLFSLFFTGEPSLNSAISDAPSLTTYPKTFFSEAVFSASCTESIGKTEVQAYLSVDMPNTFSMSPEYVRRFVERNGLCQPAIDFLAKLRERVAWLLRSSALPVGPRVAVVHGDAVKLDGLLTCLSVRSVGAIVTSPPYLGILRYGAFNWIRLWFLGNDQYAIDRAATDHGLPRSLLVIHGFFPRCGILGYHGRAEWQRW